MESSPGWSFRTYMDAGEYGLGALTSTLVPGLDCPHTAQFLPATLASASCKAYWRDGVICIFKRDSGAPLWRHSEAFNQTYPGRTASELVVRSIPSIAHYDYVIDWVFTPSGTIEVRIGATSIDAVKGVPIDHMSDPLAGPATAYGSLVAPGLVAIHHDHYFSLRLDLDIDGPVNCFVRERVDPGHPAGGQSPAQPVAAREGSLDAGRLGLRRRRTPNLAHREPDGTHRSRPSAGPPNSGPSADLLAPSQRLRMAGCGYNSPSEPIISNGWNAPNTGYSW
jgi:Cu2+-containing amine oxidase